MADSHGSGSLGFLRGLWVRGNAQAWSRYATALLCGISMEEGYGVLNELPAIHT
ncbi:hypothetical protein K0M31_016861, partial [Melipona bicolor]